MGSPGEEAMDDASEVERLRKQVEVLTEEKDRLAEQVKDLTRRCQKLAAVAAQPEPVLITVATQTEAEDAGAEGDAAIAAAEATSRLPPPVQQMLKNPQDESAQLQGIEALFQQQAQVDGTPEAMATPVLQVSVDAAVAIFSNHPGSYPLLLKASQFLSVLFAEPNTQQQLPSSRLFKAARSVAAASIRLLADASLAEVGPAAGKAGSPTPAKLMGWFLSLQALLLPCIGPRLREREEGEPFARDLLGELVSRLLASAEVPQEALLLKCVQLLPLLPAEPWIQRVCLDSGAIHSLALAYHRCVGASAGADAGLPKAIRAAVRGTFADNLELCVRAVDDVFVGDEFVCLEVLEELNGMEKKKRGTFRALDSDFGIAGKLLGLWAFHQRRALEEPDPQKSTSRDVLQKVSDLLTAVLLKLPPRALLQRMQDFPDAEVLQRHALAAVHATPQLRLQLAVNYMENGIIPVVIACMQMLLRHYECTAPGANPPPSDLEASFRLLRSSHPPADGWPYVLYGLEVCLHVLSHWSATKLSVRQKADVLDANSAPLLLAKGGLVDVLAELMDPTAAGVELCSRPPADVLEKAGETLQALFERNGHICLFCMSHYSEVRQMVSMGCDSLALDPLTDFPQMQQQAVDQLVGAFDRSSVKDEQIRRKIVKALTGLFESSYHLVASFLQRHPLSSVGERQSLDVHVEAVRAITRAAYWSAEDAPLLPDFVFLITQLLLGSMEGHGEDPAPGSPPVKPPVDREEAEQVVGACMASILHLLLIDPSPPTVLHYLTRSLSDYGQVEPGDGSERAVSAVMRVMQVFPYSDRIQLDCQHLLAALLGE